ncbi:MAG: hypothetical protein ACOYKA_02020 [Legionellaceae bacterium]
MNKKRPLKLQDLLSLELCLKSSHCFEKITIELLLIDEAARSKLFHEILKWRPKENIVFELQVEQMDFESAKHLAFALFSRKDLVHVFFKITCRDITKEGLEYLLGVDDTLKYWGDFTTGFRFEYQPLGRLQQAPAADSPMSISREERYESISSDSSEEAAGSPITVSRTERCVFIASVASETAYDSPVVISEASVIVPDPTSSPRSSSCCVLS